MQSNKSSLVVISFIHLFLNLLSQIVIKLYIFQKKPGVLAPLCEFEASLIYRVSSKPAKATQWVSLSLSVSLSHTHTN